MSDDDAPSPSNGRVTYRDVTDMMTRLERELRDGQSRIEGKIDGFIAAHGNVHAQEQAVLNDHLRNAAVMGEKGQLIDRRTAGLEREVESLREWRAEVRGMTLLVKFAVGSSLLAALASIGTLLVALRALAGG